MISSIFSMIPSMVNFGASTARASEQEKRAKELIKEANKLKKTPLRKEFEQAKRGADMMATQGLASTFTAQKQLDADAANNLKAIQQSSPSGAVASAAIASTIADKNRASQELLARDAEFRTEGAKNALNSLWKVGEKERDLEIEQRERREAIQKRAMALEDNALKRREMAEGQFAKSMTGAFTSLGSGLDAGIGSAISFNQEQKEADPNYEPTAKDAFTKSLVGSLFSGGGGGLSPKQKDASSQVGSDGGFDVGQSTLSDFESASDANKVAAIRSLGYADDDATDEEVLELLNNSNLLDIMKKKFKKE
jgi:hypothetical protein